MWSKMFTKSWDLLITSKTEMLMKLRWTSNEVSDWISIHEDQAHCTEDKSTKKI